MSEHSHIKPTERVHGNLNMKEETADDDITKKVVKSIPHFMHVDLNTAKEHSGDRRRNLVGR